jgi:hypothetical protein
VTHALGHQERHVVVPRVAFELRQEPVADVAGPLVAQPRQQRAQAFDLEHLAAAPGLGDAVRVEQQHVAGGQVDG